MNWSNVKLIFARELRDQLRDRRILFTILVLPLLLYPFLGLTLLQVAQFTREHPTQILVLGAQNVPANPKLIDGREFTSSLCSAEERKLIQLTAEDKTSDNIDRESIQKRIVSGEFDAVVLFPSDFGRKLDQFRDHVAKRDRDAGQPLTAKVPEPELFYNTASDKSRIAYERVDSILRGWRDSIVVATLKTNKIPVATTKPFSVINTDVAEEDSRRAAVWSKILPFVVLIWALTGAFYPAIDVCAGEKERGTLETLLSSPAKRKEIVWGKLLTIMVFSMTTAVLNMTSMGLTGIFLIGQMKQIAGIGMQIGPPPIYSMLWLLVVLIPISSLFSALSLAVAAFARSTKEGQYYLMPLLLLSLPLMMLPILPATELDLGTSLIPITGVMLLLRNLIEGQYMDALPFIVPTAGVTAICCLLAIRWATDQFNNESVLFRASERFQIGLWIRHVVRDRDELPTFTEAALCGAFLLLIRFFVSMSTGMPLTWPPFASKTVISLVALIATPAMLMAILLTRRPLLSLRLRLPSASAMIMALLLAVTIHPAAMAVTSGVTQIYPYAPDVERQLQLIQGILNGAPGFIAILVVLALAPAICEEIAFRGFILSGFQQSGHKWTAILLSSALFGATHLVLQQSLPAFAVGIVIGFIAVQTRSIWPCIGFHLIYNSLGLIIAFQVPKLGDSKIVSLIFAESGSTGTLYTWPMVAISVVGSIALLAWFRKIDDPTSPAVPSGVVTQVPAT